MKKPVFMTLLLLLIAATTSFAQPKLTLNMTSRPDPYLSNWAQRKETVIVTIVNSGTTPIRAKFDCTINKDGALIVNTKPEKMKVLDIPSGVSQYYGEDLVPFEAANIQDGADQTAARTGMLPAGSYQFCCALLDAQGKQLTAPVCKNFTLQSYQPPTLLQPEDKSVGRKGGRPMFRWTPLVPKPSFPVTYRLQVFEILAGQTPMTAFRVNRPILDRSGISGTQFQWSADFELPKEKTYYIWAVRAQDEKDAPIGENGGYATPFTFLSCCGGDTNMLPNGVVDVGGVTAKQDNRKDSTKVGGLNPGNPTDSIRLAVPTGGTTPHPKLIDIILISPTEEEPTKDIRPMFKWKKVGENVPELTYTFVFGEIDTNTNISEQRRGGGTTVVIWAFSAKDPFVKEGINNEEIKFPAELSPIDPSKSYAWFVIGLDKKGEIVAQSTTGFLTPMSCNCYGMFPHNSTPPIQSICLGDNAFIQGVIGSIWGCTGPYVPTCTQLSGSSTTINFIPTANNTPRYSLFPTNAGVHTYRITLTRGSCSRSYVFTVNVYPKVGTLTAAHTNICQGQDNTLHALNTNPPGTWATIEWHYRDLPNTNWIPWTGNLGTNPNTNPITSLSCTGSTPSGTRIYRARINPSDYGLPPAPAAGSICSESTIPITIWCPSSASVSCTSTSSGHSIANNRICSDKNGNGADPGDYPINLNMTVGGVGNITASSVTKTGGSTYTWNGISGPFQITSAMGAGTYTFSVTRENGTGTGLCPAATATYTVEIRDPLPPPTVQVIEHNEVGITPFTTCPWTICPNETGKLQVLPINGGSYPANTVVRWEYQAFTSTPPVNCANCPTGGTWITAVNGVNSINQNTNQTGPIGSNWTHVWWRVSVQDIDATCPSLSCCYLIKIKPLPCAPVNLVASPAIKCVGSPTTLSAQNGTGANCGVATSYDWYLNGELMANTPTLSYQTILPGNWTVVAKNDCGESVPSNICVVKDRILPLTLSGPCCAASTSGSTIKLTITWGAPNPSLPPCGPPAFRWRSRTLPSGTWSTWTPFSPSGSPPYSYSWNVPKPTSTTEYQVEYTRCGCTSKAQFTVTACP